MSEAPNSLAVPVEMAVACCSPLALATLEAWTRLGAKLRPTATVSLKGNKLVALIDFEAQVEGPGRRCNGLMVPLMVTLADGAVGEAALERIHACDRLVEQLRARGA